MTSDEKLLFVYLLTNPNRNMLGLYILPKVYAQDGTQFSDVQFTTAWDLLVASGKVAYDASTRIVFVKNFLRYNLISGPKQFTGAIKKLHELPRTCLFRELLKVCTALFSADDAAKTFLLALERRIDELDE